MTYIVQLVMKFNTMIGFECGTDLKGARQLFKDIEAARKRRDGVSIFSSPEGKVITSVRNSDIAVVVLLTKEAPDA